NFPTWDTYICVHLHPSYSFFLYNRLTRMPSKIPYNLLSPISMVNIKVNDGYSIVVFVPAVCSCYSDIIKQTEALASYAEIGEWEGGVGGAYAVSTAITSLPPGCAAPQVPT